MIQILEPLFVFIGIAILVKVIADAIIRSKLINKGLVDENVKYLFTHYGKDRKKTDLKWGMVSIGIGLSIMIYQFTDITSELMLGLMFFFAGIAFISYHYFAKNGNGSDKNITS